MELHTEQTFTYMGIESRVSSNTGNGFQLIKLGDQVNCENYDFFRTDDIDVSDIYKGDKVVCTFKVTKQGFRLNLNLLSITKTK